VGLFEILVRFVPNDCKSNHNLSDIFHKNVFLAIFMLHFFVIIKSELSFPWYLSPSKNL
jgi:hypothetical protein